MRQPNPIPIREREATVIEPSPVRTYKLSEEERLKYLEKCGPIKKDAKKPMILSTGGRKKMASNKVENNKNEAVERAADAIYEVIKQLPNDENNDQPKDEKKLTMDLLDQHLQAGMTPDEIAKEYSARLSVVRMLQSKLEKKAKNAELGADEEPIADEEPLKGNDANEVNVKSLLKIASLRGCVLQYDLDHIKNTVSFVVNEDRKLEGIPTSCIPIIIQELEELQNII